VTCGSSRAVCLVYCRAIDQLFPIMPIHRLQTKPTQLAILADLTCDSDGKIDQFICSGTDDVKSHLEVHELEDNKPYYIGMFLNGAYQEVLGNLHNLYGDTNVIHVSLDPEHKQGCPSVLLLRLLVPFLNAVHARFVRRLLGRSRD
jgi:arginine decarboxylase-like protein